MTNTNHAPHDSTSLVCPRPSILSPNIALGLVLVWTRTRGSYAVSQLLFELTASTILKYVRFGRRILLLVLMVVDEDKIKLLMDDMIWIFRDGIQSKYPTL
jgi:hypothetical protein